MAREPLAEIRSYVLEALNRVWGYSPKENASTIVPDELREHVNAVHTDALPEQIADEILANIEANNRTLSDVSGEDSPQKPMILRLRPRGYIEDDWTARPTETFPWPIVLVHGTGATNGNWEDLAEELRGLGHAVFAPGYGSRATGPIQESAKQIGAYIDAVLQATGAEKVVVVGHSQGGLVLRYWMHVLGGADKVHHMVSLAAPNHGTTLGGIASPLVKTKLAQNLMGSLVNMWFGPAAFQQVVGSPIIEATNKDGDTEPGVGYTCIATRSDSVIQPPETCFLQGENVRNLWVQDLEPGAMVLHENLPEDKRVRQLLLVVIQDLAREVSADY